MRCWQDGSVSKGTCLQADDLSSISRIYMVTEGADFHKLFSEFHMCARKYAPMIYAQPHMDVYTNTHKM